MHYIVVISGLPVLKLVHTYLSIRNKLISNFVLDSLKFKKLLENYKEWAKKL